MHPRRGMGRGGMQAVPLLRLRGSDFAGRAAAQVRHGEGGGDVAHLELAGAVPGGDDRVDLVEDVVAQGHLGAGSIQSAGVEATVSQLAKAVARYTADNRGHRAAPESAACGC